MKTKIINSVILPLFLTCFYAESSHGEWWQGGGVPSNISVPETHPIGPTSNRSDSYRLERDDDRPPREKPRDEPGFFQQMFNEWEKNKNEKKHLEDVRRIREEAARISSRIAVNVIPSTMKLQTRGTPFFNTTNDNYSYEIAAAPISGVRTPADQIPRENLRRAAAILAPISEAMNSGKPLSDEDISYLASQSANAMEGAPLGVEIRNLPNGREDVTRQIVRQSQELGQAQIEAEMATTERLKVEEQLVKVQNAITRGEGDSLSLMSEREKLLTSYKNAYTKEAEKKDKIRGKSEKIRFEWVSTK